jgi:hypothetical protein
MSIRPAISIVRATPEFTEYSLSTSISITSRAVPLPEIARSSFAAAAFRPPRSRIVAMTWAPLRAKPSAINLPKPELVPVIRTTGRPPVSACAEAVRVIARVARAAPLTSTVRREIIDLSCMMHSSLSEGHCAA